MNIKYFPPSVDYCIKKKNATVFYSWNLSGKTQHSVRNIEWNPNTETIRPALYYPWYKRILIKLGFSFERNFKIIKTTN